MMTARRSLGARSPALAGVVQGLWIWAVSPLPGVVPVFWCRGAHFPSPPVAICGPSCPRSRGESHLLRRRSSGVREMAAMAPDDCNDCCAEH
eukprot:1830996-Pyramimonas_sp.AAC.1